MVAARDIKRYDGAEVLRYEADTGGPIFRLDISHLVIRKDGVEKILAPVVGNKQVSLRFVNVSFSEPTLELLADSGGAALEERGHAERLDQQNYRLTVVFSGAKLRVEKTEKGYALTVYSPPQVIGLPQLASPQRSKRGTAQSPRELQLG